MSLKSIQSAFALVAVLLLFAGCKDEATDGTIDLKLAQTVGTEDYIMDQMVFTSPVGYKYSVITLRYYLSRLKLKSAAGSTYELADVIYHDARTSSSAVFRFENVPNGEYTHLEFVYGLDEEMNVDGGLENTMENINMEWPIPGDQGYHYMKYEGKYDFDGTGDIRSFNLHTGATGGNQNFFTMSLPITDLVVDGDKWEIELNMDLQEWLQNPQIYDFEEYGPAIMMNQDAQAKLKANGSTVFSVTSMTRN